MDEDWKNALKFLMCTEICDGTGAGICDGAPSTCSSLKLKLRYLNCVVKFMYFNANAGRPILTFQIWHYLHLLCTMHILWYVLSNIF